MFSAHPPPSPTVPPAAPPVEFAVGATVRTTGSVAIRRVQGGPRIGAQAAGATGTIVSGPEQNDLSTWWEVDFGVGTDGWLEQVSLSIR